MDGEFDSAGSIAARDQQKAELPLHSVLGQTASGPSKVVLPSIASPQSSVAKTSGDLPAIFGRYQVKKKLGSGAMGAVYLARDTLLDRDVALKTPTFENDEDGELLKRFYREARAVSKIKHHNLCGVYDVGEIDGRHYISMEFVSGRKLTEFIKPDKPMTEKQVMAVVRKIALAMQEAHSHGVIHRDLKPDNIMINGKGEPVVMDFGLVRQTDAENSTKITQQGSLVGSPTYMSKEQIEGDHEKLTAATDQYSLGVILYQLLTAKLPFEGGLHAVLAAILTKEPPPPSQHRPDLNPHLEAVCLKMMAKLPGDRYPSMKAASDAIAEVVKGASKAAGAAITTIPASVIGGESPVDGLTATFGAFQFTPENQPSFVFDTEPLAKSRSHTYLRIRASQPKRLLYTVTIATIAFVVGILAWYQRSGVRQSAETPALDKDGFKASDHRPHDLDDHQDIQKVSDENQITAGEAIDLLAMVKLPDHAVLGKWQRQGSAIACEPAFNARLMVPVAVTGSYQLKMSFTRRSNTESVGVILPVGETTCALLIDCWAGTITGLDTVDGQRPDRHLGTSSAVRQKNPLENGILHELEVTVSQQGQIAAIQASIDGNQLISWRGKITKLSLYREFAIPSSRAIGILAQTSIVDIHSLTLELDKGSLGYRLGNDWKNPLTEVAEKPNADAAKTCVSWNGKQYFFSDKPMSLSESQYLATRIRGRLLTISSEAEESFIRNHGQGRRVWMAGWCSPDRKWRDERNRLLRHFGAFGQNQPDNWSGIETQLAFDTLSKTGWDDATPDHPRIHACIEWGEEYTDDSTLNASSEDKVPGRNRGKSDTNIEPPLFMEGSWHISRGELVTEPVGVGTWQVLAFGDPRWTDYDVKVETLCNRPGLTYSVICRFEDQRNFWHVSFGAWGQGNLDVVGAVNGEGHQHPSRRWLPNRVRGDLDAWQTVEIQLRGDVIKVSVDREAVATTSRDGLQKGCVGFQTFSGGLVRWRNLEVREPNGTLIWKGFPSLPSRSQK
jgi:serine/threonine protein kinase